jgi:DNA-binding beta-propeller fold protein YncE
MLDFSSLSRRKMPAFYLARYFIPKALVLLLLAACKGEPPEELPPPIKVTTGTVYVVNEGQFQAGNASLSLYDPQTQELQNEAFLAANGRPLGDVFQSMCFFGGKAYLLINNSAKIEVIDPSNLQSLGTIEGLSSPRFMLPWSADKAYVSDLYADFIQLIDPSTLSLSGQLASPGPWVQAPRLRHEQMLRVGDVGFVTNYQRPFLYVINPLRDAFVDSIAIGLRASRLQQDADGYLWVAATSDFATDDPGALYRVDPGTRQVLQTLTFPAGEGPGEIALNPTGDTLYYTSGDLFALPVRAGSLPTEPLVVGVEGPFGGIGADPASGDLYLTDVIDFVQRGLVLRFSASGQPLDTLRVGVGPMRLYFGE